MKKCSLCKKNEAVPIGSHIVPHLLLSRIENIEGKTKRGFEVGFVIQDSDTEYHFGQSVIPEKLNEIFGDLSEKEIEENTHPLIVKYLFCKNCEQRLSIVEGEYTKTLKKFSDIEYDSGIASEIGLLFWGSILWRMSINKKSGVQLRRDENEILRRVLDRYLSDDFTKIDLIKMRSSKDLNRLSYKLFRCPNYSDSNTTILLLYPRVRKPYCLLIDEFILLFSFNNKYNDYPKLSFLGLEEIIPLAKKNSINLNEIILPIEAEILSRIIKGFLQLQASIVFRKYLRDWDSLYISKTGKVMPDQIKTEIFTEMDLQAEGKKWTSENWNASTSKVLRKYGIFV